MMLEYNLLKRLSSKSKRQIKFFSTLIFSLFSFVMKQRYYSIFGFSQISTWWSILAILCKNIFSFFHSFFIFRNEFDNVNYVNILINLNNLTSGTKSLKLKMSRIVSKFGIDGFFLEKNENITGCFRFWIKMILHFKSS